MKTSPYTVTIFDMQVKQQVSNVGTQKGGFTYRCIPVFYTELENVQLFYNVVNIAYGQTVQTNYPDSGIKLAKADNNNTQLIDI